MNFSSNDVIILLAPHNMYLCYENGPAFIILFYCLQIVNIQKISFNYIIVVSFPFFFVQQ